MQYNLGWQKLRLDVISLDDEGEMATVRFRRRHFKVPVSYSWRVLDVTFNLNSNNPSTQALVRWYVTLLTGGTPFISKEQALRWLYRELAESLAAFFEYLHWQEANDWLSTAEDEGLAPDEKLDLEAFKLGMTKEEYIAYLNPNNY